MRSGTAADSADNLPLHSRPSSDNMSSFLRRYMGFRSPLDIGSKELLSEEQGTHWPVFVAEVLSLAMVSSCFGVALYFALAPRKVVPFDPPVVTMVRPEAQVITHSFAAISQAPFRSQPTL